jgi:replicative DNA helicase
MSEIEQSILGSILLDYKKSLPIVQGTLTMDDFYVPRNAAIYSAMLALDKTGMAIDLITVTDYLRSQNILEAAGGAGYITGLSDFVPTTAHIDTYCEQLKNESKQRKIARVIMESNQLIKDGVNYKDIISKISDVIAEVESDKVKSFVNARDIVNDVYEGIKNGRPHGIMTGYEKMDKILKGIDKEDFIILAADTGKGKSAMALNIISNVLARGLTVLLYSIEMSNKQNISRLVALMSETDSRKPDSDLMEHEQTRRLQAFGLISGYDLILNQDALSVSEIRATAKAKENELNRQKRHIDFIVVDYAQIINPGKHCDNRQQEVAEIGQQLNALTKDIKCPVMLLSQVNGDYQKEKRRLRLGDLRESKALAHPATLVMLLNKDKDDLKDPMYTLEILKNRHGPQFYVNFEFIPQYTKFVEIKNSQEASGDNVSWTESKVNV